MTRDLLGHLAEHMLFLSTATSFWYSCNSSFDHGLHPLRRLGMTCGIMHTFLLQPTWLITIQNGISSLWLIGWKYSLCLWVTAFTDQMALAHLKLLLRSLTLMRGFCGLLWSIKGEGSCHLYWSKRWSVHHGPRPFAAKRPWWHHHYMYDEGKNEDQRWWHSMPPLQNYDITLLLNHIKCIIITFYNLIICPPTSGYNFWLLPCPQSSSFVFILIQDDVHHNTMVGGELSFLAIFFKIFHFYDCNLLV